MFSTMLNCCHRLEKLIIPLGNKSLFPICTKVRSCSTNPLKKTNTLLYYTFTNYDNYGRNCLKRILKVEKNTYMYGIQGGCVSDKAVRYALKLELLSIRAQYSLSPSCTCFCHSNRLTGAESRALNSAKYELKLLIFLRCFMILMNFMKYFSRISFVSAVRILVLALNKE